MLKEKSLYQNKRADASMIILIFVIMFFLAISFLVVNFVGTKMTDIMDDTALNQSPAHDEVVAGMTTITSSTIDNGFVLFFAFIVIGIVITSFLIRIHVVWLFLYIIFLSVGILLAVYLGNAYQAVTEVSALSTAVANMPKTIWIMRHSVKIVLAMGALSMIVIFSKIFREGGYVERF